MQDKPSSCHQPLVLVILDGFGYSEQQQDNAIAAADTPNWDRYWQNCPHTVIDGSGTAVGLPDKQMGNSEVGHLNIGAGRIIQQEMTRIDAAIEDGSFFTNPVFCKGLQQAKQQNRAVHVLGLLSPGGVHSHQDQIFAFFALAAKMQIDNLYFHPFLDGRDTPPQSAMASLQQADAILKQLKVGRIATIIGRYFAMDRDKRWDRSAIAYDLLTTGRAEYAATTAEQGLLDAYARGETDEFVKATVIGEPISINDGDVLVFLNFRADRARQLTRTFIDSNFNEFHRSVVPKLGDFISLTQYAANLNTSIAYAQESYSNVLGACIAGKGWRQLRIAETEKYAHVTFFFNGGVEVPFPLEDRILIPSPKVATYDLQPEMSASELTDRLIEAMTHEQYAMIIVNFANADMVGHSGKLAPTIEAIETLDKCLGRIEHALLAMGGEMIITADHGNAECMQDESTGQPYTAHTNNLVPFVYLGRPAKIIKLTGSLRDIAPTMLYLLNLETPVEMTGSSLLAIN